MQDDIARYLAAERKRRQEELAQDEAEQRAQEQCDRDRAELVVLEAIEREGVYWPGQD